MISKKWFKEEKATRFNNNGTVATLQNEIFCKHCFWSWKPQKFTKFKLDKLDNCPKCNKPNSKEK